MPEEYQSLPWDKEAKEMIPIIPALFRDTAKVMIEKTAKQKKLPKVTLDVMLETREKMFKMLQVKEKSEMPKARDFLNWQIPRIMIQQVESPTYWLDVDGILDRIHDAQSWIKEWTSKADQYLQIAQDAEKRDHKASARNAYALASNYYRWAHFTINKKNDVKKELSQKSINAYIESGKLHNPPIERIEIPFGKFKLPGYFQKAPNGRKAPCIICVHGADSTKEEMMINTRMAHSRGFASATFDGPGQAETAFREIYFTPRLFTEAIASFVDYLQNRPDVDPDKIGLWGVCFGGHLALRAAANDKRIKACVSNDGALSYAAIAEKMPPPWIDALLFMAGYDNWQDLKDNMLEKLTIEDEIKKITCPALFVHGVEDQFIPTSQSQRMLSEASGPKQLMLNNNGDHCSANLHCTVWPAMYDWLYDRLGPNPKPINEQDFALIMSSENPGPASSPAPNRDNGIKPHHDSGDIIFTREAQKLFDKIPFFMKKHALKNLKAFCRDQGIRKITPELMLEVRKKKMGSS